MGYLIQVYKADKDLRLLQYYDIKHVSTYALTVESKTLLEYQINKNLITMPSDDEIHRYYMHINSFMTNEGYINYEMNSYAKNGFYSKNNSGYWLRKKYIGIGPSAHSYDGISRSWNISNNAKYISNINGDKLNSKREVLSKVDMYNEYVDWIKNYVGCFNDVYFKKFWWKFYEHFINGSKHLKLNNLSKNGDLYTVSTKGRFLTDGIAAELFLIKLNSYFV